MAALWAHLSKRLIGGGAASSSAAAPPLRLLHHLGASARSYHRTPYEAKVGIPEFLRGVGKGVEAHVAKLEAEIGDIQNLLVARTLRLKKLGIPCKHRKLILKYTQKYRLGLWRPRAEPQKLQ
ncbi:uncharacterized protein LOC109720272 [Ananas comosus]|uniref:Uncharacterized protein LOC109720272 n=1 Tax=Ananas comosus TaxID=4615 RepID=A0A6P5G4Q9_ANACO|nr:uncharacterized protein LOC109720272 [Ananas comosus]